MPDGSFKPGDQVPITGIYTASHYQHRLPHEVFAVEGDQFPTCRRCGTMTRFLLLQAASHIDSDHDFSRATPRASKAKKARAGHRKSS